MSTLNEVQIARQQTELSLLESASRTASGNTSDFINIACIGIQLYLDVTAVTGTSPTLNVKLQAKDPTTDGYFDIPGAFFSEVSSTGKHVLTVYPGADVAQTDASGSAVPRTYRVAFTLGGTDPDFTFSLGGCLLV